MVADDPLNIDATLYSIVDVSFLSAPTYPLSGMVPVTVAKLDALLQINCIIQHDPAYLVCIADLTPHLRICIS